MTQQNLIVKVFDGSKVFFMEDGYINATKAAKHFGKQASKWFENDETKEYIKAISKKLLFEQNQLVIVKPGAPSTGGGTWIHPKLAVRFARWLSLDFELWCDDQIELILRQQQQTPQQRHIQQILDLLYSPVNLMSFEQISLSERLAQRRFTWTEFQEFFRMKNNTWFLRVVVGIINLQVLGMSAGQFRRQILGPNRFRIIHGAVVRQDVNTRNVPNNLTKDFLPKPHQECIQQIMQDLLNYFTVRPGWTRTSVRTKLLEFIVTRKGNMEILIGRDLHELVLECIRQVGQYAQQHDISPYQIIQDNLIQLNYNQLALEREIRRQQIGTNE